MPAEKYYLALKCLVTAFKINAADPVAHEQTIRFRHTCKLSSPHRSLDTTNPTTVTNVPPADSTNALIDLANTTLPKPYNDPSTPLASLNTTFLSTHSTNAPSIYAVARSRHYLDSNPKGENEELVLTVPETCPELTLEEALEGVRTLKEISGGEKGREVLEFVRRCREKWPEAEILLREAGREL